MRNLLPVRRLGAAPLLSGSKNLRNMWMFTALSGFLWSRADAVAHRSSRMATSAAAQSSYVKYNILAFGDSLTEGYYDQGTRFHPYSVKLEDTLRGNGYSVKVHERGHSGELVVGGMDRRLPALLRQSEGQAIRFDWVVILGGINDLGWGGEPDSIFRGLQSLYGVCIKHGAQVLALTCMETVQSRAGSPDARSQLNDLIRGAAAGSDHITVLDLEKKLPFPHDATDKAGAALWDDGLHLTPAGYDTLAGIVYEALQDRLEK